MPILPAKCFKKVYRKKEDRQPAPALSNGQTDYLQTFQSPQEESQRQLLKCASLLYAPVDQSSLQAKAIMNHRVKKLKKTLRTQASILKAMKEKKLPIRAGLNSFLNAAKPNARSLHALNRVRDSSGKFLNPYSEKAKSDSHEDTAADSAAYSSRASHSRPSLMSGCFEDFFTYQNSEMGDSMSIEGTPICQRTATANSEVHVTIARNQDLSKSLFVEPTKVQVKVDSEVQVPGSQETMHAEYEMVYEQPEFGCDYPLSAEEANLLSCLQSFDNLDFPQYDPFHDHLSDSLIDEDEAI